MTKPWQISRRTMLRGAGAMMALPLLDAMAPVTGALARAAAPTTGPAPKDPVRMAVLYMPNGALPEAWSPSKAGKDFELTPTLAPLKDFRDDVLVLSELMNAGSLGGDGHYVKTAGFLTGTTITKTTGKDLRAGGVSMDQLAAQRIGRLTPLPSLELGIEPVTTGIDSNVGYTRLYGSHIAWSTPTTPVAKEINPRLAFDRLFRPGSGGGGGAGTNLADDRSVLDLVAEDAKRLRAKVGHADQVKLDDYLDSVRSVERRIESNTRRRAEESRMPPAMLQAIESLDKRVQQWEQHPERDKLGRLRPRGDHADHVRLMLDLVVLGFWSDSTRVSTFMFGNAVSPRNFSFLDGVQGGHHQISHHQNDAHAKQMYQRINQWHVEQVAYLLGRLKDIKETSADGAERTLLDNSMVLFGSGMRDGNQHDPKNLPLLLAGRGGGTIKPGRHVVYKKKTPLCNLWAAMLDRVGAPVDRFGDSTEKLGGLDDADFAAA